MSSSYGVSVWYPTYVSEITSQRDKALLDEKCRQNVTDLDIGSLQSYCDCNDTVFHDSVISDARLQSWMVGGVTFSNMTFTNVIFDNVVMSSSLFMNNCTFRNSTLKDSKFVKLTWREVSLESLSMSSSVVCGLQGLNVSLDDSVAVYNTSINGVPFNETSNISSSHFLELLDTSTNSTCSSALLDSKIDCQKPDSFAVYRDSFFVSASALPGNIASAIAVYFLRRNYWLGKCDVYTAQCVN